MRQRSKQIFFLGVFLIISLGFSLGIHRGNPEVREWDVTHPSLPDITVALLSDFHFSSVDDLSKLSVLRRQILSADPDLIVLAGDYIGSLSIYEEVSRETLVKALESLVYPIPAFAVLGNHDNWDSREQWIRAFDHSHIRLIENEIATSTIADATICVRGLGDYYSGHYVYVEIPESCRGLIITVTHDPAGLIQHASTLETLSLAGHTHCGQIALPFIGPLIVPTIAPKKMHCGRFQLEHTGITSGGIGTSILPIRFGPDTASGWELVQIQTLY